MTQYPSKFPCFGIASNNENEGKFIVKFTSRGGYLDSGWQGLEGIIIWQNKDWEHIKFKNGYKINKWNKDYFNFIPTIESEIGKYYSCIKVTTNGELVQFDKKNIGFVIWSPKNSILETGTKMFENQEYIRLSILEVEEKKEKNKMSTKNLLSNVLESNQKAAIQATKLNSAKIALDLLQQVAKKNLPAELSAHADSPVGLLVIANIVSQLVPRVTQNELACEMADDALVAAYQEVLSQLGIHNIVQQFVSSVGLITMPKE
jgi:hypothetical protein